MRKWFIALALPVFLQPALASADAYRWPVYQGASVYAYVDHQDNTGTQNYACNATHIEGHRGTDLQVAGVGVYAAGNGWVMYREDGHPNNPVDVSGMSTSIDSNAGNGFGNFVVLLHGGGYNTIYGHLSPGSGLPEFGREIACGSQLGTSGNSGNSAAYHLHYELRSGVRTPCDEQEGYWYYYDGSFVDPYSGACSQATSYWTNQNSGSPTTACNTSNAAAPPVPSANPECSGQSGGGDPSGPVQGDYSEFVSETIPDGTVLSPGQPFTKVWTIRNAGTTSWTRNTGYYLRYESGTQLNGPESIALDVGETVAPGDLRTFSMTFAAPSTAGTFRGTWRMYHNATGTGFFGDYYWYEVRVSGGGGNGCWSPTVGTTVEDGDFVQVTYGACNQPSCAWYRCTNGNFACADASTATSGQHVYAHPSCMGGGGVGPGGGTGSAPCYSQTLGQEVPSGDCVQVSYSACGMGQCAWYKCSDGGWQCTSSQSCTGQTHGNGVCGSGMGGTCACSPGLDNYCQRPPGTAACSMTWPGGYCDPNGDGSYSDADWTQGYFAYQASCAGGSGGAGSGGAGAGGAGGAGASGSGGAGAGGSGGAGGGGCAPTGACGCMNNTDNFCFYGVNVPGCGMTAPGGYCDPNGDGSFSDGDWNRGYNEYQAACGGTCNGPSCGQVATLNGWANAKCEWNGNNACGGWGTPTFDCDRCCP